MKIRLKSNKHFSLMMLTMLFVTSLACGASSNEVIFPTADPGALQTAIVGTAAAAELQTLAASPPEQTSTPEQVVPLEQFTNTPIPVLEPTEVQALTDVPLIQIKTVNKIEEYVELENTGDQPQDITGWVLVSERGNQACTLSGTIMPGEVLRVWASNPSGGGFNCNFGTEIWNNTEHDPAVLYDSQGQQVVRYP